MPLNLYVGATLQPTDFFFEKAERIFLLDKSRYLMPDDKLKITAFDLGKTSLTTQSGEDYFRFSFAFEECCDGCRGQTRGAFAHHRISATITEIQKMFIVDEKETKGVKVDNIVKDDIGKGLYTAEEIASMILDITRMWNSRFDEKLCVLHFGRYKYQVLDPLGTRKVQIKQISGYSVRELTSEGENKIPMEWLDPIVAYFNTYKREFAEIARLEEEIADLSHRLGHNVYGAA